MQAKGKPTGRKLLERFKRIWEDNIIMGLKEIAINTRNLVDFAQDRNYCRVLVNSALNILVPYVMELVRLQRYNIVKLPDNNYYITL